MPPAPIVPGDADLARPFATTPERNTGDGLPRTLQRHHLGFPLACAGQAVMQVAH